MIISRDLTISLISEFDLAKLIRLELVNWKLLDVMQILTNLH